MITVYFNKPEFEYDVHSLVKAFFPKEEVEMYYLCEEKEVEGHNLACTHKMIEKEAVEKQSGDNVISIEYGTDQIRMIFRKSERTFPVNFARRTQTKNLLKQNLYELLQRVTGQMLPWGTLTGIRPTKIPMMLLDEGKTENEIEHHMKETYFATDEKIRLSIEIAKREKKLLEKIDYEKGYSLYIGIPFCPSTCLYCSFTSYPLASWKTQVDAYLDALEKELDYVAEEFGEKTLNSVYIGGGTPTTLEPYQLDRLLKKIKNSFDLSKCVEFTVEAGRPDSITEEKLRVIQENGIDRISVNPQTMKQQTLDLIGRHHTVEQTIESFWLARKVGITNINMDLILGLPEESIEDVRHTMEIISELKPENITIHSLAVKRAARLHIFKDYYKDMQMVNTQEHMDLCEKYCRKIGLAPYYLYRQKGMAGNMENVGYAAEGKAGVYNILIMEEKQTIVACGAGATTKRVWQEGEVGASEEPGKRRIERAENVKDVRQYMDRMEEMILRKKELFSRR